jgi:hypothetical protein
VWGRFLEQVRDSSEGANGRERLKLSQQRAVQVLGCKGRWLNDPGKCAAGRMEFTVWPMQWRKLVLCTRADSCFC